MNRITTLSDARLLGKLIFDLLMIILGIGLLIFAAIDGVHNGDYAHGCYDILIAGLCLGWFKTK